MDERDFLDALSVGRFPSKEASEYFSELRKSAGVGELAGKGVQKGLEYASKNKAPLLGALIGGAAVTALQYLSNKPGKNGEPSKQRRAAEESLAGHEKSMAKTHAEGRQPSFSDEMSHSRAKATADVAKITEKHPVRGSLLATPMGAAAGYGLGAAAHRLLR